MKIFTSYFIKLLRNIFLCCIAAFFALSAIYLVVPPPSTLMLARWVTLRPAHREWVPLTHISPNLQRAVVAAEDAKFCTHHGVDWESLYEVVHEADEDGPERGASTISMQVARNLFLWQGRSYIRKGLEIPIALTLELLWPKRRILEVYLNIAEWGDGVFGAQAAAQQYYHHSAAAITPYEGQLMAMSLPNPHKRRAGKPGEGLQELAGGLAARMQAEGVNLTCVRN